MRRSRLRAAMGAACVFAVLMAGSAGADPPNTKPNGPWEVPNQEETLKAIRDYDQLIATLQSIVRSRPAAAELTYSPFRAKGSGRAIPIVTIGNGARGMMVIANQHGNEYVVSNSAVELIRALTGRAALDPTFSVV